MSNQQAELDALLRQDLGVFIEKAFQTISPADTYMRNWHIDCLAYHLDQCAKGEIKRLIITLPPRNLKSICASVAFPAWVLGRDPQRKIICASYAKDLAFKLSRDCRSVMDAEWYKRAFPGTRIDRRKNSEQESLTTKKGSRFSTSIGGSLTGYGADIIIIDDPIKPNDAMSDAERGNVNDWYDNTLYSRLNSKKDGVIIIVTQRVHVDDLVGHVLEKDDWVHVNIPAIALADEVYAIGDGEEHLRREGDLLHPGFEDEATLEQVKRTLGTYTFEAQYQQTPAPPGGNMFKEEWLQTYDRQPQLSYFDAIYQSWDTALAETENADYSVCTTWGVREGRYYLLDVYRKRLAFPDLVRAALDLHQRFRPRRIIIENVGSGISLCQTLRREHRLTVQPSRPEQQKEVRAATQSIHLEQGKVYLPEEAPWLHEFKAELLAFPNSKHDDQVDSMVQFLLWMDRWQRMANRGRPQSMRPSSGSGSTLSRYPSRQLRPSRAGSLSDLTREYRLHGRLL